MTRSATEKLFASGNVCHQQLYRSFEYVPGRGRSESCSSLSAFVQLPFLCVLPACLSCLFYGFSSHTFSRATMLTSMLLEDLSRTSTASFPPELVKTRDNEVAVCCSYTALGGTRAAALRSVEEMTQVILLFQPFGVKMPFIVRTMLHLLSQYLTQPASRIARLSFAFATCLETQTPFVKCRSVASIPLHSLASQGLVEACLLYGTTLALRRPASPRSCPAECLRCRSAAFATENSV